MKPIPVRQIKSEKEVAPNFRIRTVESLLGGGDMLQELHRHNFYFILALQKGKGAHAIDFKSYRVDDHCFFIMRPGQVHQLTLKAGSTGYLLEFNSEFYQLNERGTSQVLRQATHTNFCQMDSHAFSRLHSVLSYIMQEYHEQREGYQQIIKSNLNIFFIEFLRHRKQHDRTAPRTAYALEKLHQFLEVVEQNLRMQKQVSEYAAAMNMSVYQLNNITKTTLGKRASEVINDHIILEAKRYLLATSEQVSQIAYHLGYEDASYFIRFFKKHTKHTPESFRSNFK
jgi:AraC family transcriptional regulator, transcriptional activator of pobA